MCKRVQSLREISTRVASGLVMAKYCDERMSVPIRAVKNSSKNRFTWRAASLPRPCKSRRQHVFSIPLQKLTSCLNAQCAHTCSSARVVLVRMARAPLHQLAPGEAAIYALHQRRPQIAGEKTKTPSRQYRENAPAPSPAPNSTPNSIPKQAACPLAWLQQQEFCPGACCQFSSARSPMVFHVCRTNKGHAFRTEAHWFFVPWGLQYSPCLTT